MKDGMKVSRSSHQGVYFERSGSGSWMDVLRADIYFFLLMYDTMLLSGFNV